MSCADKFPVSSSSLSLSSSKFVTNFSTKPLLGHLPPPSTKRLCPPLTCLRSKTKPLPTKNTNYNKPEDVSTLVLKKLELGHEIEDTLVSFGDKFTPKDITVILNEQCSWEDAIRVFNWFKSQKWYVHNVIHYNVVLRELGRAKQWEQLSVCWIEMAENNVLPTNGTYSMLVNVCGEAGLANEAVLWVKHMRMMGLFPNEITMKTVVKVLRYAKEYDRATRFYRNWFGGRVDLDDLDLGCLNSTTNGSGFSLEQFLSTELLKTAGGIPASNGKAPRSTSSSPEKPQVYTNKKNEHENVLYSVLKSLELGNEIEDTLNSFGDNFSPKEITIILNKQQNWERVVRVFRWFKSRKWYVHNGIHYNVVLRALGRAQQWSQLRLCWIEMAKNNVFPTNNTYSILVDVYGKAGLANEALSCIKHMRMRDLFPDEVTMSTVVKVLKDVEEFDRADRFYKNWCGGRVDLDDLYLDSLTSTTNGSGFTSKQFLSTELFKISGEIPASNGMASLSTASAPPKPRLTATYNTLIDLYGKAGRLRDAADVFDDMVKSNVAMDACTLNTMILITGSHGNLSEAEALLVKMEENGISPNTRTYNTLLSLYANAGNIDAALSCYKRIREARLFPDVVTQRALFAALCKENMVQAVEAVIDEMGKSSIPIDEHALPGLVRMYLNEGTLDKANALLQKFEMNKELSSVTRATIIDAFAEKGLWAAAKNIFYTPRGTEGQTRDVVEYNVMIKTFGKARRYKKAVSLFKEMKNHGIWPNGITYNSIIQMLSGADRVDEARDLLVEMQKKGFKPLCQTFSAVLGCYTRFGMLPEAVSVYKEMVRAGVKPNEVVYTSIINGFAEHGRLGQALEYFYLMEESGFSANLIVLSAILNSYAKSRNLNGVKAIYERIKNTEGGLDDINACNSMITAFADLGLASEARLAFENLKEMGKANYVSYEKMMQLYSTMGSMSEVIKIAEEMRMTGLLTRRVSYNKVLMYYATDGKFYECGELLREMISKKLVPNDETFKVIFAILFRGGFPMEAAKQLEISYREGKPYASQLTFTALFSVVGMHALALKSVQAVLKSEVDLGSYAYNVAIYAYVSAGEAEKALNIYMDMRGKNVQPDIVTCIHLVGCYGKAGLVEGVKQIRVLVESGAIKPSESLIKAIRDAYENVNLKFNLNMMFANPDEYSEPPESDDYYSEPESDYDSEPESDYDFDDDYSSL